jgi:hypothetical protein
MASSPSHHGQRQASSEGKRGNEVAGPLELLSQMKAYAPAIGLKCYEGSRT